MRRMCPNADDELARWWGERCRAATSPGAARALIEMASLVDVRDVLGAVQAPTLVAAPPRRLDCAHRGGQLPRRPHPRRTVRRARGADHFVGVDPDQILDPVEEFVLSLGPRRRRSRRSQRCSPSTSRSRSTWPGCAASCRGARGAPRRARRRGAARPCWRRSTARHGRSAAGWRSPSAPRQPGCMSRSASTPPRSPAAAASSPALAWRSPSRGGSRRPRRGLGDLDAARPHRRLGPRVRATGRHSRLPRSAACRARRGALTWMRPRHSPTPASPSARPRCSLWSGST